MVHRVLGVFLYGGASIKDFPDDYVFASYFSLYSKEISKYA